jgi:hypothetical protein
MEPDVSVVVVSWRTRELTLRCIERLLESHGGLGIETIVVDNASGDGTIQALRASRSPVTVIECQANVGFAAACNLGLERVRGRLVLLLNPDAEMPQDALARLADFLDAHPRAGAVGASLISPEGDPQFSAGRFLTPLNQFSEVIGMGGMFGQRRSITIADDAAIEVDWVPGACVLLRRDALDQVGRFDERFFMYSEDEDLCYRLRQAGWPVYVHGGVRVRHVGGASARQAEQVMRAEFARSQARFVRKHRGFAAALLFRLLDRVRRLKPWGAR